MDSYGIPNKNLHLWASFPVTTVRENYTFRLATEGNHTFAEPGFYFFGKKKSGPCFRHQKFIDSFGKPNNKNKPLGFQTKNVRKTKPLGLRPKEPTLLRSLAFPFSFYKSSGPCFLHHKFKDSHGKPNNKLHLWVSSRKIKKKLHLWACARRNPHFCGAWLIFVYY